MIVNFRFLPQPDELGDQQFAAIDLDVLPTKGDAVIVLGEDARLRYVVDRVEHGFDGFEDGSSHTITVVCLNDDVAGGVKHLRLVAADLLSHVAADPERSTTTVNRAMVRELALFVSSTQFPGSGS